MPPAPPPSPLPPLCFAPSFSPSLPPFEGIAREGPCFGIKSCEGTYLIISHDGYIVTTLPLGPVLGAGGTGGAYAIPNIPGGSSTQSFAPGLYYLHSFVWNSAHPFLTLKRIEDTVVVDLRTGSATNVDLTLN